MGEIETPQVTEERDSTWPAGSTPAPSPEEHAMAEPTFYAGDDDD